MRLPGRSDRGKQQRSRDGHRRRCHRHGRCGDVALHDQFLIGTPIITRRSFNITHHPVRFSSTRHPGRQLVSMHPLTAMRDGHWQDAALATPRACGRPLRALAARARHTDPNAPCALYHVFSTDSQPAGLLQKSFRTRGSSEADHPAISGIVADGQHQPRQIGTISHARHEQSAMPENYDKEIASHASLAITQTSRSCTSSGGTPKFFFAALMAAFCFWSGRNAWSPELCRRTGFGFTGSYPSD